jgi:hypothetical protein
MKCNWHLCPNPVPPTSGKRPKRFCSKACAQKGGVDAWRRRTKARAVAELGGSCARCGYNRSQAALCFHHEGGKEFAIAGQGNTRAWNRTKAELAKCTLLCMNCHAEEHAEQDEARRLAHAANAE